MNDQQWYYESNGEQAGPISWDGLMAGIKMGMVTPETRVRPTPLSEWTPLGECILHRSNATLHPPQMVQSTNGDLGVQIPTRRTITAKQGWIIIAVVLAVVIGIGAAVAPSSSHSSASAPATQPTGEWQGEALNQRMGVAVQMLNDGSLKAERFIQLRSKFKAGLDQTDGKQLMGYANFLWAATGANHLPAEIRIDLNEEGASVLKKAEAHGYTQAYVMDGSWTGGIRAGGMVSLMGPNDPRTKYWPILSTVQKWVTGATKGDQACRFMMDHIAPNWEGAQSVLGEHMRLETAYSAKPTHAPGDPDIAKLDELKQQWILASGMVPIHAQAHPQHAMPCWDWLNDKGGDLFVQWIQAHPQK